MAGIRSRHVELADGGDLFKIIAGSIARDGLAIVGRQDMVAHVAQLAVNTQANGNSCRNVNVGRTQGLCLFDDGVHQSHVRFLPFGRHSAIRLVGRVDGAVDLVDGGDAA